MQSCNPILLGRTVYLPDVDDEVLAIVVLNFALLLSN